MDNRPSEGVYDLEIEGATYDRDNGQFECRMKEGGSGRELHSKSVTVTGECRPLLLVLHSIWFMLNRHMVRLSKFLNTYRSHT